MSDTEQYHFLWEKTEYGGARLLRVYGRTRDAILPEAIEGCPLEEIGDYCFSERETEEDRAFGREMERRHFARIAGSYPETVILPGSVRAVGRLAFYGCRELKCLKAGPELTGIGSDAFMNCRSLKELVIACDVREKTGLKQILAQISHDLTVVFQKGNTVSARVFYPEYREYYDEIAPAHIFGRNIEGEGFRARQSFKDGVVDLARYDQIFPRACAEESEDTLISLAAARLEFPVELRKQPEELYAAYLKAHGRRLAERFVGERDLGALRFFCEEGYLAGADLTCAVSLAAEAEWAEGAASLLAWKKKYDAAGRERYSFDDF